TRTGAMQPFKPGLLKILKGVDAPVIPIFLDQVWGSIFSYERGRFFWKWPKRWPYPIDIHIGQAVCQVETVDQVSRAVETLGVRAVQQRTEGDEILPRAFLATCRRNM